VKIVTGIVKSVPNVRRTNAIVLKWKHLPRPSSTSNLWHQSACWLWQCFFF